MAVVSELALLFAAAAACGLVLLPAIFGEPSPAEIALAAATVVFMVWLGYRGWRQARGEARTIGWQETLLRLLVPAAAILCVRALRNGAWF